MPLLASNGQIEPLTPFVSSIEMMETFAGCPAGQVQNIILPGGFMWKRILVMAVLGIATAAPFLTAGCASSATNQPNAVTGMVSNLPDSQNPRYQDQKHHFHPEWVDATGH